MYHCCPKTAAVVLCPVQLPHPEVFALAIIVHKRLPVWVDLRYPGLLPAGCHVLLCVFCAAALPAVLLVSCAELLGPRRDVGEINWRTDFFIDCSIATNTPQPALSWTETLPTSHCFAVGVLQQSGSRCQKSTNQPSCTLSTEYATSTARNVRTRVQICCRRPIFQPRQRDRVVVLYYKMFDAQHVACVPAS